jgi:hypothetical protein
MRTWGRYTGTLVKSEASDSQIERLATSLENAEEEYKQLFRKSRIVGRIERIRELDNGKLTDLCNEIVLIWERSRRAHIERTGEDNVTVAKMKAAMDWPSAALAVRDALSSPVDAPTSAGQRRWIRSVVRRALEILSDNGYEITAATAQALLWYPERSLYEYLIEGKVKNSKNLAYDEALVEIARSEGHDEQEIEEACLRALEHGRGRRVRNNGGARQGDTGPVPGVRDETGEHRGRKEAEDHSTHDHGGREGEVTTASPF